MANHSGACAVSMSGITRSKSGPAGPWGSAAALG